MRDFVFLADSIDNIILRLSAQKTYIHGSSANRLRDILKTGVTHNPKNKVWSKKDNDLESMHGSYWTTDMSSAWDAGKNAARKNKTNMILVFATLETRDHSIVPDEDHLAGLLRMVENNIAMNLANGSISIEKATDQIIGSLTTAYKKDDENDIDIPKERWQKKRSVIKRFVEMVSKARSDANRPGRKPSISEEEKRSIFEETADQLYDLTTKDAPTPFRGSNVRVKGRDVGYKGSHKITSIVEVEFLGSAFEGHRTVRTYRLTSRYGEDNTSVVKAYIEKEGNKVE